MFNIYKKSLITLTLTVSLFSASCLAEGEDIVGESIADISTVVAVGVGGAILGLSTLSFVEEPTDHLKNIVVGGSIGIIIGVGIVAFKQANKSKGTFSSIPKTNAKSFQSTDRLAWHKSISRKRFATMSHDVPQFNYSFSF